MERKHGLGQPLQIPFMPVLWDFTDTLTCSSLDKTELSWYHCTVVHGAIAPPPASSKSMGWSWWGGSSPCPAWPCRRSPALRDSPSSLDPSMCPGSWISSNTHHDTHCSESTAIELCPWPIFALCLPG